MTDVVAVCVALYCYIYMAGCSDVLQCVAVNCNVSDDDCKVHQVRMHELHCVAVCCSVCCGELQCVFQSVAVSVAVCCSVLQSVAECCRAL